MIQKNIKTCVECGAKFYSPPSAKTVTCSLECRRRHAQKTHMGHEVLSETRQRISAAGKLRDMSELQKIALEAAKNSPNSGRFETNVNAIDWHLISPEGKHYYFHSLSHWLRQNVKELFGCEPDSREYNNVRSGLTGAKRAMMGKKYPCCTYKGWRVQPTKDDNDGGEFL